MRQRRYRPLLAMLALALAVGTFLPLLVSPRAVAASTSEPGGNNIAVGHTATADSQQASQPASSGNDGDATTYWCATDSNPGHWWEVDLGGYNNLSGTGIDFGVNKVYQYKIEVSRDNTNWHLVADQTGNTDASPYQYASFYAPAERYVRVTITGLAAGQWACFAEFKAYAQSQGENVAQGKSVTADSAQSDNPASAAVDGTVDTSWKPADTGARHWLTVDLKYDYTLTGAEIIWDAPRANHAYHLETSLDGVTWRPVNGHDNAGDEDADLLSYQTFRQVKARYLRVTLTGWSSASNQSGISELQIFQPFMKGVDISTLLLMEQNGAVYSDHGVQKNFLQILRENGVNYVRVRLWVNPANPPQNQPGVDDLPYVLKMARMVKATGMQFFLDFHYSDTWADPGKQFVPAAWSGETPAQLAQTLHDYTADVISQLSKQDTLPDMVQIGNEINCGMLWPSGNQCNDSANWATLASYVNAGIKGVRDATPAGQNVRIALHYAGNWPQWWFNGILSNGVSDFDTIALSWYVMWHSNLATLGQLIPSLKAQYGRDVIVAEFAYPWTFQNFDNTGNSVGSISSTFSDAYPVSPAGQAQLVEDELTTVKDTGGLGAFYWEPGWYAVPGAGWQGGAGDGWENMAQVDQNGAALPSLSAYLRY